ncbi:MAG TPA: DNA topoisomerase III, partial [Firmicutes bacterium]|nr:DNA topoisomerase III [Bacillota bacterium]
NPARVRDHHAIIPTEKSAGSLRGDEAMIYDLVARRFIAAFYPDCQWKETRVITRVEGEDFESKGRELVSPGWRQVEGVGNEQLLPVLSQGDPVKTVDVQVKQDETKPLARYTEGTLLAAMEGAGKMVEEEELREAM